MNYLRIKGMLLLTGLALWACSGVQSPSQATWTARPEFREVDNQHYNINITPQKGASPFFSVFVLTIANKSKTDLMIDWNASPYLFNGRPEGMMVFEGIDPKMVNAATVPVETITPGAVFSREIMPLRLIAWTPLAEGEVNRPRITPGMLPAGNNGIRLAIRHEGEQTAIPLVFRISREASP